MELTVFSLHRRYPTVERRARLISPTLYYALPHDNDICDAVMLKCSKPTEEVTEGRKGGRAGKASRIILACDQDDEVKPLKALQNGWLCHWLLGDQDKIYIKPVKRSRENFAWPQSQLEIYCPTWE